MAELFAIHVDTCLSVAVGEVNPEQFVLYPNPASKQIYIRGRFAENSDVFLCDLNGEVLCQKQYARRSHYQNDQGAERIHNRRHQNHHSPAP